MLNTNATLTSFGHWKNYSVHAIDGVFALFELIFNRHFLQPVHSVVVAFVMLMYMCLTFVVRQTKGTWVYPFLDWDQGLICIVYYLGIAVGLFVIYFLLMAVHRLRNRWLAGRCAVVNKDMGLEEAERKVGFGANGGRRVQPEENADGGYHGNQSDLTLEEGGVHGSKGMQTY
jgi:hypothetical protein